MSAPVGITRTDHTSGELRALSGRCSDGAQVRRMLALALVLDGRPRTEAAELNGMDRQTLRDWVHRYNAEGVEGLKSRRVAGPVAGFERFAEGRVARVRARGPRSGHRRRGSLAMRGPASRSGAAVRGEGARAHRRAGGCTSWA